MSMTLEQVRKRLQALFDAGPGVAVKPFALAQWIETIDAHLCRQSDGPSDEDVSKALMAAGYCDDAPVFLTPLGMRAALTAIWHNRPAQSVCPYIVSTGEGSSYCRLAESSAQENT